MWHDPIIQETRRAREEYAAQFNFDLEAIFEDLRVQQEEAERQGWKVVSFPPRPPESAASKVA